MTKMGYPDWGVEANSIGVFSNDSNEMAVRLGSNYRITRTGKILVESIFTEDSILWGLPLSGDPSLSTYLLDGLFRPGCLRYNSIAAVNSSLGRTRSLPYIIKSLYGLEFSIKNIVSSSIYYDMIMEVTDDTNETNLRIRFDCLNGKIWARNLAGAWELLCLAPQLTLTGSIWIVIKIIWDLENKIIKYISINGTKMIFTDFAHEKNGVALNTNHIDFGYELTPPNAVISDFRIGHFILTFDESER